ncbi:MAG: 1-acyl-sn-glycerol-3-phosphate acyltransferase [Firmicutes bacterium]|nr:1-acyl-sn-glycerol-3-phosphate acyltransferase [Bacillota bacterium]
MEDPQIVSNKKEKTPKSTGGFSRRLFTAVAGLVKWAMGIWFGFTLEEDPRIAQWKASDRGFIILCGHTAEADAAVLLAAVYPRYARFVVGAQQLYKGLQGRLLRMFDVIPRKQFVSDIASVKEMMKTVRDGHVLGMMPEGRVSLDGRPSPVDGSTAKLLKKLGCPVAVLVPEGSYWIKPPYDHKAILRGPLKGHLKVLLEEGEAASLSAEEITDRLNKAIYYDESKALSGTGRRYQNHKGQTMKGVSNLFYLCPSCGAFYTMHQADDRMCCSSCGAGVRLTREMVFLPEKEGLPCTVPDWNDRQLAFEKQFWKEGSALFSVPVTRYVADLKGDAVFRTPEKGLLTLDRSGLSYKGETDHLQIALSDLPGVSADYEDGFIACYEGDIIRRFVLDDVRKTARFVNSLMTLREMDQ